MSGLVVLIRREGDFREYRTRLREVSNPRLFAVELPLHTTPITRGTWGAEDNDALTSSTRSGDLAPQSCTQEE